MVDSFFSRAKVHHFSELRDILPDFLSNSCHFFLCGVLSSAIVHMSVIIGVALIFDSAFGAGVLTILMGVSFLSEGILNLYTVIRTVLIVKNQVPDFVETDTIEFFERDR